MASRGFLIRFIDIGLIILFGFLMISDIEASSRVELADSRPDAEALSEPRDEEGRAFVLVEIGGDGVFQISDAGAEEEPPVRAAGRRELEAELSRRRDAHTAAQLQTVVLIQPAPASQVQFTVDVMDVCDRLSLVKSLRMDIEIGPAAEPEPALPADTGDAPGARDPGVAPRAEMAT